MHTLSNNSPEKSPSLQSGRLSGLARGMHRGLSMKKALNHIPHFFVLGLVCACSGGKTQDPLLTSAEVGKLDQSTWKSKCENIVDNSGAITGSEEYVLKFESIKQDNGTTRIALQTFGLSFSQKDCSGEPDPESTRSDAQLNLLKEKTANIEEMNLTKISVEDPSEYVKSLNAGRAFEAQLTLDLSQDTLNLMQSTSLAKDRKSLKDFAAIPSTLSLAFLDSDKLLLALHENVGDQKQILREYTRIDECEETWLDLPAKKTLSAKSKEWKAAVEAAEARSEAELEAEKNKPGADPARNDD